MCIGSTLATSGYAFIVPTPNTDDPYIFPASIYFDPAGMTTLANATSVDYEWSMEEPSDDSTDNTNTYSKLIFQAGVVITNWTGALPLTIGLYANSTNSEVPWFVSDSQICQCLLSGSGLPDSTCLGHGSTTYSNAITYWNISLKKKILSITAKFVVSDIS